MVGLATLISRLAKVAGAKSKRTEPPGAGNISKEKSSMSNEPTTEPGNKSGRFLGSLKDALAAASREDTGQSAKKMALRNAPEVSDAKRDTSPPPLASSEIPVTKSAAEAAREARTGSAAAKPEREVEVVSPPTTKVVRGVVRETEVGSMVSSDEAVRTQLVRGKQKVKRGNFKSDPVVGWLVVVGGPGIGSYRPVFEGNNTVGRAANQRIPLDFGDEAISSEEQAYIRYDSSDRSFLFVPNLAKTNVVSINDKRPTGAVELKQMDVIVMGRTQLVFVPFCGPEFDWSELSEAKA